MTKKKAAYYVYSTLAAAMDYTTYQPGGGDLPQVDAVVRVEGGANIPDKYMRTPLGVCTPVTEAELEALRKNDVFNLHEKNGFIIVRDKEVDVEVAAADMEGRDKSAPLVPADFPSEEAPKVNTPETRSNRRA